MSFGTIGSARYTADQALGGDGAQIRVFNVSWLSGATAGDVVLRNGTSASGDVWVQQAGVINDTVTLNFEGGLLFTDGLFFDKDTNVTAAVISYRVEK